jgi:hypothetical protein
VNEQVANQPQDDVLGFDESEDEESGNNNDVFEMGGNEGGNIDTASGGLNVKNSPPTFDPDLLENPKEEELKLLLKMYSLPVYCLHLWEM